MRAKGTATWLKTIALPILFSVTANSAVLAQTPAGATSNLEGTLTPGTTAWITDSTGREAKTRIVSLSDDIVTIAEANDIRHLRKAEVTRVRVRDSDSLVYGALSGAGAGVASGLFLCRLTEPWENCRDDVGPMIRFGAIGAGIGIGIDALIRGRKTIYDNPGATRLHATPIVGRRAAGLQVSLTF
jgi:hypothetical protein